MSLSKPKQPKWEEVTTDGGDVYRLEVPGGWLYQVTNHSDQPSTLVFVPFPVERDRCTCSDEDGICDYCEGHDSYD